MYCYGANNPVRYVDPDGREIRKAILILKNTNLSDNTKNVLSEKMINNLYKAENKRLNIVERIGIDGKTIGRGQLGNPAYTDVCNKFEKEMKEYGKLVGKEFSGNFKIDIRDKDLEDFIVSAYLSLCIENRQKEGRTKEDAAKFGIGYYHGARNTIIIAQEQANDKISFNEIQKILIQQSKKSAEIIEYINEVYGEN